MPMTRAGFIRSLLVAPFAAKACIRSASTPKPASIAIEPVDLDDAAVRRFIDFENRIFQLMDECRLDLRHLP